MLGLAVLLSLNLQAADLGSPSAVAVFADTCGTVAGDRKAIQKLAAERDWAEVPYPQTEGHDGFLWADAYQAGPITVFTGAYPAGQVDPSRAVSVVYPAGTVCGVLSDRWEEWREPLRAIAEDRLGMVRMRPAVRRNPDGDFQTAAWQADDGYIDAQFRRAQSSMRIARVRNDTTLAAH
ncbi:hypothetical protein [Brevundimonas sp. PAMC22021]|uniref:hypothetical protein n=1 Tax=Brevundimonas sp. PAMC22021 TaxID=2861285 RepID=UPI001C63ADC4|nr:hypothetical protein [Brevundimonas sp. PAMC22021]QYF86667.1 hypothetical protein KY493_12715 [Brevundimonas sp. PAMC22021]